MPGSPGYSGKPLSAKLGITAGVDVLVQDAPDGYLQWIAPLPPGSRVMARLSAGVRFVHLFVTDRTELQRALVQYRERLPADVVLWVSWPKKSSRMPTDVSEDVIRELALPLGWVDVKVCAVSEIWSGLKLVVRRSLR